MAPEMLATLAAAYAEIGKVPEAIKTAEDALSRSSGNAGAAILVEKLLTAFRAGQAYREGPAP